MLYRRECVRVPDGGVVTLDWLHDEAAPTGARGATELPLIVILPGLAGGSSDGTAGARTGDAGAAPMATS